MFVEGAIAFNIQFSPNQFYPGHHILGKDLPRQGTVIKIKNSAAWSSGLTFCYFVLRCGKV